MWSRKNRIGGGLARALFYSLCYPDVFDFTRFSIYIVISVFERFPDHLVGLIGHEIAHIIASRGEVKMSEEELSLLLRSRAEFVEAKEKRAYRVYPHFREPIRSMIERCNQIAVQSETDRAVAEEIHLVDKEQFDGLVFGERIADYKQFIKVNLDRIRGTVSYVKVTEKM